MKFSVSIITCLVLSASSAFADATYVCNQTSAGSSFGRGGTKNNTAPFKLDESTGFAFTVQDQSVAVRVYFKTTATDLILGANSSIR